MCLLRGDDEIGSKGWQKGKSDKTLDFSMTKSDTSSVHDFVFSSGGVWFQSQQKKSARDLYEFTVRYRYVLEQYTAVVRVCTCWYYYCCCTGT